jgi:hypothetical protein
MADGSEQAGGAATQDRSSDEQMREAYEAELNRVTSVEMILQTAVSLLNIGGRRLGLGVPSADPSAATGGERDLEQVRDAIDAAGALLPILERRMPPRDLGPLRDAIAQLQVAYAREAQKVGNPTPPAAQAAPADQAKPAESREQPADGEQQRPGPAQASGRLWVPGQ